MSSNPQDLAMAVLNETFRCSNGVIALDMPELRHLSATKTTGPGFLDFEKLTLGEIVDCLAEAGLLVTPQASSAERSEEPLVSAVAEGLRDFKFEVGPNTLEMMKVGQAVYLTPEERHQIAHAAVNAYQQVVRDE